jgi:acetyl-CoA carboxylase biotin carboxyl carrier protein
VGTVVKPDTVVCIIEAMKVFNQIQGEKAGRIVEILVQSGDAVGFGQPLFRLEPA